VRNDVTYIAIILGLFALAFLLVAACDRIIGPDSIELDEQGGGDPTQEERESDDIGIAA
jgi:hypothetical protein